MLPLLLLPVVFFGGLFAQSCPTGYFDEGDGSCQSGKFAATNQFVSYSKCAADNGYMLSIQSAFDNSKVNTLSGGSSLWLGLTCTGPEITSCLWDTGISILNSSYQNFALGHPNINIGPCVYFNPATNLWYSASCGASTYFYICRITPGIDVPACPAGSYFFRGKCYYPVNDLRLSNATNRCNANCGNIASIHNAGENSFVLDVALMNNTDLAYTYIGLSCTNENCRWSDGTGYNYNAFGYKNLNIGSCVFLTIGKNTDIVPQGYWISTDCLENEMSVCKRDLVCTEATDSPETCAGTQFLSGTGEIVSPGHPRGAIKNHCSYVITQNPGYGVSLSFAELSLDPSSTIKIYNTMTDTIPFATIKSTDTANSTTYYSADNLFKIVFDTPGNTEFKNSWRAKYDVHKEGVGNCGGIYASPSTIAGPHFAQNCTYTLKVGLERTCLMFTYYGVQSRDYIAIYDGEVAPQNNIAYISRNNGSPSPQNYVILCTSNFNYMNLVTIGNSGQSYEMFTIVIAGSPNSFKGTSVGYTYQYDYKVPRINTGLTQSYSSYTYAYRYYADPGQRVNAAFSYLNMTDPSDIVILDGDYYSTVALAYGSPTRMTYQSSQESLTVMAMYRQASSLPYYIGFTGNFTAV